MPGPGGVPGLWIMPMLTSPTSTTRARPATRSRSAGVMNWSSPSRPIRRTSSSTGGARTSRWLIESLTTNAVAALVLESPLPGGALKTARKGAGIYHLAIEGVAAHAGIEPGKGASALLLGTSLTPG